MPLILTFLRLLLGPAFLLISHRETAANIVALMILVVIAMVTDWLDGMLARRWNVVSSLGKLLDPFADALFCMMVFLDFALTHPPEMPLWLVVVLIAREATVSFLLRPLALAHRIVVAAGMPGKVKTVIQFVTIFAVLVRMFALKVPVPDIAPLVLWAIAQIGFAGMLCFSLASAGQYAYDIYRALKDGRTGGNMARLDTKGHGAAPSSSGTPRGGS